MIFNEDAADLLDAAADAVWKILNLNICSVSYSFIVL